MHKHQTVTVSVSATTVAVEFEDGDVRVIRRTTDQAVRSIKGQRPRTAYLSCLVRRSHFRWRRNVAHHPAQVTACKRCVRCAS